jgi:hypothetical protein
VPSTRVGRALLTQGRPRSSHLSRCTIARGPFLDRSVQVQSQSQEITQDGARSAYTKILARSGVSLECQLDGLLENFQWGWRAH